jgi:predicted HTH domain antitoxin
MTTKTTQLRVEFVVTEGMSARLRATVERESKTQTVVALWRHGVCSASVAAKMLGGSLRAFLVLLAEHGLPYVDSTPEGRAGDRRALTHLRRAAKKRAHAA